MGSEQHQQFQTIQHHLGSGAGQQVTGFFLARLPSFTRRDDDRSRFPELASAASKIELFHLPIREIEKRFTKSELSITAWVSQETADNMDKRNKPDPNKKDLGLPSGLPDHFFNSDGELDLRNAKGAEIQKFFQAQASGSEYEDD